MKSRLIAELGINHGGNAHKALRMAHQAAACGADAVKLQYYNADKLINWRVKNGKYNNVSPKKLLDDYDLLRRCQLSLSDIVTVKNELQKTYPNVEVFASVFDPDDVKRYFDAGFNTIKISAEQVTRSDLAKTVENEVRGTGRYVVQSLLQDGFALKIGSVPCLIGSNVTTLYCPSGYPVATLNDTEMSILKMLCDIMYGPVGLSFHSKGPRLATAIGLAYGLGARVFEFHVYEDDGTGDPPEKAWSVPMQSVEDIAAQLRSMDSALETTIIGNASIVK